MLFYGGVYFSSIANLLPFHSNVVVAVADIASNSAQSEQIRNVRQPLVSKFIVSGQLMSIYITSCAVAGYDYLPLFRYLIIA
jgi:hypothetical protein